VQSSMRHLNSACVSLYARLDGDSKSKVRTQVRSANVTPFCVAVFVLFL
jgi:hypothetical protein